MFLQIVVIDSFLLFPMKKMAKQLQDAVLRTLNQRSVPQDQQKDYLKWLLFYFDFCLKYHHAPRDEDSLAPFLQKLAEKRQSPELQRQAAASVALKDTIARFGRRKLSLDCRKALPQDTAA